MRAVTIRSGELQWVDQPDPIPSGSELLVAVRAAGVNPADLIQLRGHYPAPPGSPPDIPGLELAGEVVAVGPRVLQHQVGDRVMALVGGGAQAELALVEESSAIRIPDSVGWIAAGGFPEAFSTAYDALFTQGRLGLGERLLVTGAAGGVGTAAVQLAAAAGARVTASVRSPARRAEVEALGAAQALEPDQALEAGPFDLVLELVGGPKLAEAVRRLDQGGRLVVIGVGAGRSLELDLSALMSRRAQVFASTLRARPPFEKAAVARAVEKRVVPLLASGRCAVQVAGTYPLAEAGAAYQRLAAGGNLGKIVLVSAG
ncbi:MAG: zinc-binding dehydrogenase [Candidatus Dormiibacterota bacterium]